MMLEMDALLSASGKHETVTTYFNLDGNDSQEHFNFSVWHMYERACGIGTGSTREVQLHLPHMTDKYFIMLCHTMTTATHTFR